MSKYLIAHIGHTGKHCEHITWWNPDSKGYTISIDRAGLYAEEDARSICQHGGCIAVPKNVAESVSRSTPYYRRSNGTLNRLYDGDKHTVVENSKASWAVLFSAMLGCGKPEKPTPIGAKARAIYLHEGGAA